VQGSVGEPILRDLFGTMHAEKCDNAIVVTTGKISKQAREWIAEKPIRIIELKELRLLIDKHFVESDIVPRDFDPNVPHLESDFESKFCPKCGSRLLLREGRRGQFYSCSDYPKCNYWKK
jgi:restriction system protein